MITDGQDKGTPPEEADDALWRLLERAPRAKRVSPYFARRVLREVALLEESRPTAASLSDWLPRIWRAPRRAFAGALGAVTLVAAGGLVFSAMHGHTFVVATTNFQAESPAADDGDEMTPPDTGVEFDPAPQGTVAMVSDPVVTAQDVEVIADLDNLLSREESRLWTEDDTARF